MNAREYPNVLQNVTDSISYVFKQFTAMSTGTVSNSTLSFIYVLAVIMYSFEYCLS